MYFTRADSVGEGVDDILDGASLEEGSSTRLRLDSLDHAGHGGALDDLDMDMEDQVDGACPVLSSSSITDPPSGSVSARPVLETVPTRSLGININNPATSAAMLSSSVPSTHAMLHHFHHGVPLLPDDEILAHERPFRTSSVGSKPDFAKRKNKYVMFCLVSYMVSEFFSLSFCVLHRLEVT